SFLLRSPPLSALSLLSLHDALPIYSLLLGREETYVRLHELLEAHRREDRLALGELRAIEVVDVDELTLVGDVEICEQALDHLDRSEEHTSELQSRVDLVCRLLLEKK